MRMNTGLRWLFSIALGATLLVGTGCPDLEELEDVLEDVEIEIGSVIESIQVRDPRFSPPPSGFQDTVIIEEETTVITDVSEQLIVDELPDITLLGFENLTGYDIYLEYFVDNQFQSVLVYEGETLLLEYPCLGSVELVYEEDFSVFDGTFVQAYDLTGTIFFNPEDFFCGEALILTLDEFTITATPERIDLLR